MKKYIILLFISFLSYVSFAQKWEDKVNNDPTYIQFKEDALKFYGSADYKLEIDTGIAFKEKMGDAIADYDYKNFGEWVDNNIDKTQFISKEEAVELFTVKNKITQKNKNEAKRLENVFNTLADKFGYEPFLEFAKKEIFDVAFAMQYAKD